MSSLISRSDELARSYARFTGQRPWQTLGVMAVVVGLCAWYGSGVRIRSNMEDLFPESTPAVQAAKQARATLRSTSQMIVVFGSPNREANHALATRFCDEASRWPEVAAVECRREIDFFRRNGALFLDKEELLGIETDVQRAIREASARALAGDEFAEDLADEPTAAVAAPATATAAGPSHRMPADEDLQKRFKAGDIREWNESADGTVLGIKLFPTVPPQQIDESAKFVGKVNGLLERLKPKTFHPQMQIATSGDYSELTEEVDNLRRGLYVTSALALLIIALIQVLHFRRLRALVLMSVPLLAGTALTMAFTRASVGYLNMITAFIFSMLFGMGNDFNVYTLSRYLEERADGHDPLTACENMMAGLWGALGQAAATTSVAFFALVVLEFRGFSQFGLIAGVGVFLSLMATLAMFPALVMALHRLRPDRPVTSAQAEGQRWLGWFTQPRLARIALFGFALVTALSALAARDLSFETNLRNLRTPASKAVQKTAQSSARRLESDYKDKAETRNSSPILVVTDSIDHAKAVHTQIEERLHRNELRRIQHFVSIHTFVPNDQADKLAIIERISRRVEAKLDVLTGDDRKNAERWLQYGHPKPFGPEQLPAFVRERFRDQQGQLGRFVLMYANGNVADAHSVQEIINEVGTFTVGARSYLSTASFFILAEADAIVKKEGPWAVLLATLAVAVVVLWYFRSWWLLVYSFVPMLMAFVVFLGIARGLGWTFDAVIAWQRAHGITDPIRNPFQLNLFSVTTLPGIVGIAIDGVTHILHRYHEDGERADLARILRQTGGAAWFALITTSVGFAALLFQDNPGLQSIAWWATVGLLVSCLLSNVLVGALVTVLPPPWHGPTGSGKSGTSGEASGSGEAGGSGKLDGASEAA
jgi:predicted RND superfamily exporter protein